MILWIFMVGIVDFFHGLVTAVMSCPEPKGVEPKGVMPNKKTRLPDKPSSLGL